MVKHEYLVVDEVLARLKSDFPSVSVGVLVGMVKRSAPITHPGGNRRYKDFIFRVTKSKAIVNVAKYHAPEVACRHCQDTKKVNVFNVCVQCNGDGCPACDGQGGTKAKIPCFDCIKPARPRYRY